MLFASFVTKALDAVLRAAAHILGRPVLGQFKAGIQGITGMYCNQPKKMMTGVQI